MHKIGQGNACNWRSQWQPTPVLLPGKSHGPRRLVGYSPWGCKESDMTERLHFSHKLQISRIKRGISTGSKRHWKNSNGILWVTPYTKSDKVDRTELFENCKLPKLTRDEMYNVNSPIIRKLHLYLKKLPIRKISDLDGFTSKVYQTFKEIILHNLSQETEELNTLQLMKPVLPW